MRLLLLVLIPVWGCGDYVTKSDLAELESAQEREINELERRIDDLEETFVSDVIINTEARTESGFWERFGGTINTETNWRYLEASGGEIRGGYTTKWTNNTNSDITVSVGRLVFEDANGIQIGEYEYLFGDEFSLDAGQSRDRTDNFSFFASVSAANQVVRMGTWAGFAER